MAMTEMLDELENGKFTCFIFNPFDCEKNGGHVWDGKPITFRIGAATGGSATCSKCGIAAIDFDMQRCD